MPVSRTLTVKFTATSDGDNTIVSSPGVGFAIVVVGFVATGATTAGIAQMKSSGGLVLMDLSLGVGSGVSYVGTRDSPAFRCLSNQAFMVNNSAGLDTYGGIVYFIDTD